MPRGAGVRSGGRSQPQEPFGRPAGESESQAWRTQAKSHALALALAATDGERSEFQLHAAKGLDNDSPDCGARVMFTASV